MTQRTPNLFKNIWLNFKNSITPRQITGIFKGEDYMGTKYYEIPPNPSIGKRKASRWYEPIGGLNNFDKDLPAEWMSWLRFRRAEPPTKEEIDKNLAIMEMKKTNSAILEAEADEERKKAGRELTKDIKGFDSFPKYEEYYSPYDKTKKPN